MARAKPLLPFQKNPHHDLGKPPSTPKLTPRKAIIAIFLMLLSLSLLHGPVTCRYNNGIPREGHGLRTVEQRARHILSETPLIGNSLFSN